MNVKKLNTKHCECCKIFAPEEPVTAPLGWCVPRRECPGWWDWTYKLVNSLPFSLPVWSSQPHQYVRELNTYMVFNEKLFNIYLLISLIEVNISLEQPANEQDNLTIPHPSPTQHQAPDGPLHSGVISKPRHPQIAFPFVPAFPDHNGSRVRVNRGASVRERTHRIVCTLHYELVKGFFKGNFGGSQFSPCPPTWEPNHGIIPHNSAHYSPMVAASVFSLGTMASLARKITTMAWEKWWH